MKRILMTMACVALLAGSALAINPGTEVWTPAAARGAGAGGSFWVTDLFVYNPNSQSVTVDVYWLTRDQDSSGSVPLMYTINPGATLVLEDVILNEFGASSGGGGFLVRTGSELQVATDARIYNRLETSEGTQTFGQGFEGVPTGASLTAGARATSSSAAVGGKFGSGFRTNFYGVNTSSTSTTVRVVQLDAAGNSVASTEYTLAPWAPLLKNVSELGGPQSSAVTLAFEVLSGSGIFGLSTIDELTGDPTTHAMWWELGSGAGGGGGSGGCGGDGVYTGSLARSVDPPHPVVLEIVDGSLVAFFGRGIFQQEPGLNDCGFVLPWGGNFQNPISIASDGSFAFEFENPYNDGQSKIEKIVIQGQVSGGTVTGTVAFEDLILFGSGGQCTGTAAAQSFVVGHVEVAYCEAMPSATGCSS